MNANLIVSAWKDPTFRTSLDGQTIANLPPHPSGVIELTLPELTGIFGGNAAETDMELFASLTRAAQTCYTEPGDGCTLDCDCVQDTSAEICGTTTFCPPC